MKLLKSLSCLMLVMFLLAGCSSTDEKVDAAEGTVVGANDASTSGYGDGAAGLSGTQIQGMGPEGTMMEGSMMGSNAALMGGEFANPNNPLSKQVIYFLYDSSQVQPEFIAVLAAHAEYLSAHSGQQVLLEGHADERGSPEYNIALSEQRAKSIARALAKLGVIGTQMDLVSYGEEKPAAFEHDDAAWQLNRRVEIIYKAR